MAMIVRIAGSGDKVFVAERSRRLGKDIIVAVVNRDKRVIPAYTCANTFVEVVRKVTRCFV